MQNMPPAYGLWTLVIINSLVFIIFAFSFTKPKNPRDWRSFGAFSAFIVALFTEMYFHLYDFIRGDDEKLLASDKALKAWQVLLPENERFPLLAAWATWVATEYKRSITRDVWRQLWEFAKRIKTNLAQYDPNEKWPTALDDFVEWAKMKQAEKEQAAQEAKLKQEAAKAA